LCGRIKFWIKIYITIKNQNHKIFEENMAIDFESGTEGEQEYVDIEEITSAQKEPQESRKEELSLAERVRAMEEDPVVKKNAGTRS